MSAELKPDAPRQNPHWIIWLFAVVGVLGVLAFIMLVVLLSGLRRGMEPAEVAAESSATHLVVRDASPIHGTNLVQITIAAGPARGPYSSGGSDDQRNMLLLDRTTGAVRRLLPDNSRRIARSFLLPALAEAAPGSDTEFVADRDGGADTPPPPPAYFALLVAQPDHDDRFDLIIGTLADEQTFAMQNLAGVDGVWMHSPTQVALIVREGLNLFYRIVDIPSRRVVLSRRITI